MFSLCHLQLGSDEVWVSHRSSQHPDSLTVSGDVCSSPCSGRTVRCLCDALEGIAHSGLNPSNIPHVRFPTMNPNVGMPQKHPATRRTLHQLSLAWRECKCRQGMRKSIRWLPISLVWPQRLGAVQQQRARASMGPPAPRLRLGGSCAQCHNRPPVRGWTTIEKVDKRQAPPVTPSTPANIARLEMRSNALTPSTEVRVNCSSISHKAWMQWPYTHTLITWTGRIGTVMSWPQQQDPIAGHGARHQPPNDLQQ